MKYLADLHIHSRFSRATSRDLGLERIAEWALRKGLTLVGTGDFTHPGWVAEIGELCVPAEDGLMKLSPVADRMVRGKLPHGAWGMVRFILSVEISTIYRRGGRTRKVHHLVLAPDLPAAASITARLGRIGNLASDGRPILGLDSRDLLEIVLESAQDAMLIPAHIWTPWFSMLGSRSGFDSVEECYGDLSEHVFAVETGLSSDPYMNWTVSALDRYRLVSSSDAHSPAALGREATILDTDMGYTAIREALCRGCGYVGTVELFPEEGKYHADGHRKCGVKLSAAETLRMGGRCPVCGGQITVGVEHRVGELADRASGHPPPGAGRVTSLVPLREVLSEILGVGPATKKVITEYERLIARLGPELSILADVDLDEIRVKGSGLLAEAIDRLRRGKVHREAGYDGEFGSIRLFEPGELSGGGRR